MSQPRLLKSHRPHRLVHLHRVYHRVIPKSRRSKTTTRLYHKRVAATPIIIVITSLNHRRMKTTRIISPHRSRCPNLNRSAKRRRIKLLRLQRRLIQAQLQRRLAAVITRSRPRLLASPKRTWKRNDAS